MSRGGHLVAAFPVEHGDEIMMVSDQGQIIRAPVDQIRIAGRATRGVILFRTADNEHVVSVEHIENTGEGDPGEGDAGEGDAAPVDDAELDGGGPDEASGEAEG